MASTTELRELNGAPKLSAVTCQIQNVVPGNNLVRVRVSVGSETDIPVRIAVFVAG